MSMLMQSQQMMTSKDYAATAWPESGTKRDESRVFFVPRYLAPVAHRMEQFQQLKQDWNSYGARRISSDAMATAMSLLVAYGARIPTPEVFPTVEGGVKFEWGSDSESVEVEFQPDGTIAILIDDNGVVSESVVSNLNDPSIWDALKRAEKLL